MIRPSVIGNIMGQGNLDRLNHQSFFLFPFFLQRWSRRLDWSRTLSTNYYKTIIRLLSKMGMKKTLQFRRKVLLLFHREESCLEKRCIKVEKMRDFQPSIWACLFGMLYFLLISSYVVTFWLLFANFFCLLRCQIETKSRMTESTLYCRSAASLCFGQDAHFLRKPTHSSNSISHLSFNW